MTQVHFSKKGPTRIRTGVVRIKTESDNHYTIGPELTGRSENHDRIRHPCITQNQSIFNEIHQILIVVMKLQNIIRLLVLTLLVYCQISCKKMA